MAALSWPSYAPSPLRFGIWLETTAVGPESPVTGAREVMVRFRKWHAVMEWGNQPYLDNLALESHLSRSDMGRIIYQVPIYKYRRQRGNKSGSVTLGANAAAGATSLTLSGGSGTLLAGDWVQISQVTDVPRAYQVTASESGGVIGIRPGLRVAHSSGAIVHHLASVPDGYIKDTMQLDTEEGALVEISSFPTWAGPLSVEFTSALRLNP